SRGGCEEGKKGMGQSYDISIFFFFFLKEKEGIGYREFSGGLGVVKKRQLLFLPLFGGLLFFVLFF
ncbi:MAG: hypothetical protein SAJ12_20030, partial [Jaaginema sp. PMC 1079.18]|nr:hypothetical protein [Jaaginema sp. PMC 1079.18]